MALVKCVECHKEISSDAKFCPHCGKKDPARQPPTKPTLGGCLSLFVVLAILGTILSFCSDNSKETNAGNQEDKIEKVKNSSINEKDLYEKTLKTPSSDIYANRDLYKQLYQLNNNSKLYKDKFEFYENKVKQKENKKQDDLDKNKKEIISKLVSTNAISIDKGSHRVYVNPDFWNTMDFSRKQTFCSFIIESFPTYSIHDKFSGKELASLNFLGEVSISE